MLEGDDICIGERVDVGTEERDDVGIWEGVDVEANVDGVNVEGEDGAKCWTWGVTTSGDGCGRRYIPSGFTRDGITLRGILVCQSWW